VAAGGDGGTDVGVGVLHDFFRFCAEEFIDEICAAGDAELFGEDAERVFAGDKMDARDALVGFEGTERFAGEDCAGGAGDGEG